MHDKCNCCFAQGDANCCLHQQACTNAEINALAAAPEGKLIAAADDDGHVTIIDTSKEPYDCQRLNGAHDNISSSVVFRRHKPKEGQYKTEGCFAIS